MAGGKITPPLRVGIALVCRLKSRWARTDPSGMDVKVLLAKAAAVVSLYAAFFHAWVFALHRRARDHAWVALAATGACLVSFGTSLLYSARSVAEGFAGTQVQTIGVPIVMLGALVFTIERFDLHLPRLVRFATAVATTVFVLSVAAPELLFRLNPALTLPLGNEPHGSYIEMTALGGVSLGILLFFFVCPLAFCLREYRRGHPAVTPLLACFAVWTACGLSDTAVGIGLYYHPFLMPTGGYMATSVALSTILLRDLTRRMNDSERRGGALQSQARARADALRAIELRLARGEQLAAIGTLAAGVAHEINNPLAYVSTNLNQLRALVDEDHDPDEVKEILAECREGLGRVGAIVTDLLRMGRHGESDREPCDLGDVVRAVLPLVVREAGPTVQVVTDVQSPLPVIGHPRLLRQAALNLALNAVHAVRDPELGRAPCIELSAYGDHGCAALSVRDNGRGVPAELRERIFETSFTTKAEGGGSGLGLALTRLVVTRHGGTIELESGAEGTAVTVRLPLGTRA
jgi:signal transduction histidine kinase